jgi:hypothetical protein
MSSFDSYIHNPNFKPGVRYFLLPNRDVLDPLPPRREPKPPAPRPLIDEVRDGLAAGPQAVGEMASRIGRDVRPVGRALRALVDQGIATVACVRPTGSMRFGRRAENVYALSLQDGDGSVSPGRD